MKIIAIIKGVYFKLIRREWITAKGCDRDPLVLVENARVNVVHRAVRLVKK